MQCLWLRGVFQVDICSSFAHNHRLLFNCIDTCVWVKEETKKLVLLFLRKQGKGGVFLQRRKWKVKMNEIKKESRGWSCSTEKTHTFDEKTMIENEDCLLICISLCIHSWENGNHRKKFLTQQFLHHRVIRSHFLAYTRKQSWKKEIFVLKSTRLQRRKVSTADHDDESEQNEMRRHSSVK